MRPRLYPSRRSLWAEALTAAPILVEAHELTRDDLLALGAEDQAAACRELEVEIVAGEVVSLRVRCDRCGGAGGGEHWSADTGWSYDACPDCDGEGYVVREPIRRAA